MAIKLYQQYKKTMKRKDGQAKYIKSSGITQIAYTTDNELIQKTYTYKKIIPNNNEGR